MVVLEGGSVDEILRCDHPNEMWNFCLFFALATCEVKQLRFVKVLLNVDVGAIFVFVCFSCRVTHHIDACPPRWKLIQIREVFIQEAIQDTLTFR